MDQRVEQYAQLLVERCIDVQPGWQVEVKSSPLARPLVEEIVRLIARRGAYPLVRLSWVTENFPFEVLWATEAPEELAGTQPAVEARTWEELDAWINVTAQENTRDGSALDSERRRLRGEANHPFGKRRLALEIPWVTCVYPTPAHAQEAGMTLSAFEDFVYGSCLLDWDAEAKRMARYADRFDRASEVRIVGRGTDLTLSLDGRTGMVDDGRVNMPGGEFFYAPVEDSAEGVIEYAEFPAVLGGHTVEGVRLEFRGGRVVDATSRTSEDFLVETLDRDPGARVLGELGIGCNPGIQRYVQNTLFDEKMNGTVHLAVGAGIPAVGGLNESSVHWDMVKELRSGGRLYCDGELVQDEGRWLL